MAESKPKKKTELELVKERVEHLEGVISRIAVLTGNGNHLKECGIKRWEPSERHMNKRYN